MSRRRFHVKHLLLPLLAAAVLVACPEDEPKAMDAGLSPSAHLEKVSGKVTLERRGVSEPAQLGYLFSGDALETGSDGSAVIRFGGGRRVEVGPDARLVITQNEGGIVLEVARGLVLSRVPMEGEGSEGADIALTIVTPFGVTRVGAMENSVEIDVGADEAKLRVLAGSVEIVSRGGQSTNLAAGGGAKLGLSEVIIDGQKKTLQLTPMPIDVVSMSGRAEVKRKGKKGWESVGKKGFVASEGDSVRGKEGRTVLRPHDGHAELSLSKGTELTFGESGCAPELEETKLQLGKGALELDLKKGRKSRVGVGDLSMESDLGGRFTVVKTADGYELSAKAGDLTTKFKDKDHTIRAGERALFSPNKDVQTSPLSSTGLLLPSRNNTLVYSAPPDLLLLTWDGPDQDYQVEVAADSEYKQMLVHGVVHANQVHVAPPARGSLYWRVKDADGKADVAKGSAQFKPESQNMDLTRNRNEVFDGSEKTVIYFQDEDKPPAVTFICRPNQGAVKFVLSVRKAASLSEVFVSQTATSEKIQLEGGKLSEGAYFWELAQFNAQGEQTNPGKMNQLELTYDNSVPSILVQTPKNGDVVRGATVAVAGVAPVGT
ncbi:MAG: hypothetical protein ACT4TC_15150, partial [Myxococcaceae bacterium]